MSKSCWFVAVSWMSLALLVGCGGTASSGACQSLYPASQGLSAPCCLGWGVDACGAGLTCAALDGRSQPTCYPAFSRADGLECNTDVQCVSHACDTSGVCKSMPGAKCTAVIGCGPGGLDSPYYCGSGQRCVPCESKSNVAACRMPAGSGGADLARNTTCVDDTGNSKGVGQVCNANSECVDHQSPSCFPTPDGSFCTAPCHAGDDCGENAECTQLSPMPGKGLDGPCASAATPCLCLAVRCP